MLRDKRRIAIKLRKSGKSYLEIRKKLGVAKSTLSLWLRDYHLTPKQTEKLNVRYKAKSVEKYRETVRKRNEKRLLETYNREKKILLPITKREFFIAGLFLYLGEGAKSRSAAVSINNTDPNIVKFTLNWYTKVLKIPKEKIKVNLQLYKDMNIKENMDYWSKLLDIPLSNFHKPYIKKTTTKGIDHSGYKHGTCGIYHGNARLHEKIMMSMQCILDRINKGRVV
jgi:transposase-like protein